jgi:hypothetical protein
MCSLDLIQSALNLSQLEIVAAQFPCNAQGQCMYFARTKISVRSSLLFLTITIPPCSHPKCDIPHSKQVITDRFCLWTQHVTNVSKLFKIMLLGVSSVRIASARNAMKKITKRNTRPPGIYYIFINKPTNILTPQKI